MNKSNKCLAFAVAHECEKELNFWSVPTLSDNSLTSVQRFLELGQYIEAGWTKAQADGYRIVTVDVSHIEVQPVQRNQ